ncbi:MAG: methyltransferase domain-containing protein [Geothrix sp.]|uniref:class I SAM-dependent methyltransferase n=1 Tax=Geothrix sp. TaxID=1962974 RepID=UPI0017CF5A96|nr:class I SAM-dependent methyltransferase [Geothrix sp.]NWJ41149.1 methyltransferase domain-containing protein [Geothrix sp.]WIL20860.1 MAG: class I SAM-dependent methyltransferase [Geothrix sp.]
MTAHPCPICAGDRTTVFLRRDGVPVHQNLVMATPEAARSLARGDLTFAVCPDCGFVFNQAFDLARLAYGEDYDNTQSCSATFNTYLDGLVEDLVDRHGVRNCAIVEVGCGKGGFLRKLVEFADANNTGTGFDPSYVGEATSSDGRLTFRQCYYDDACTEIPADVVVCRHVIEHVPDPMSLLRSVRAALSRSPRARVFFETPCVDWILRNQVVWDFFYEHCSLFTASSLGVAFERAGFAVDRVKHIFGGQYLWLEARVAGATRPTLEPGETVQLAQAYGAREGQLRQRWQARLLELGALGPVALWGAGAKGATLANLADPDGTHIDCVVDLNPNKQGGFIPGTGHPIVAPADLPGRGVKRAILMNPNYRQENLRLLAEHGINLDLLDWSEP